MITPYITKTLKITFLNITKGASAPFYSYETVGARKFDIKKCAGTGYENIRINIP